VLNLLANWLAFSISPTRASATAASARFPALFELDRGARPHPRLLVVPEQRLLYGMNRGPDAGVPVEVIADGRADGTLQPAA
jgi:hypothetical protein